jgi:hypothetical protein
MARDHVAQDQPIPLDQAVQECTACKAYYTTTPAGREAHRIVFGHTPPQPRPAETQEPQ